MSKRAMKEYRIWKAMKSRCYAPSQTKGNYKKNHIGVCERWRNSFSAFIEDMGMMPDETYSIERIDVYKDYEPDNCIWIPQRDQPKNRANCMMYTLGGRTACLKDWARCFGVKYTTAYERIRRSGYSFEKALEIPKDPKVVSNIIKEYYEL